MDNDIGLLLTILFSSIIFTALYFIFEKFFPIPNSLSQLPAQEKFSKYWAYIDNYVSFVHAVIMIILCSVVVNREGLKLYSPNTELEEYTIAVSLSYFIVGTIFSIAFELNDRLMLFHHVLCILSIIYPLFKGYYGNIIIWSLFYAEISNPFMLLWKNFDVLEKKTLNFIFGFIFSIMFVVLRTYFVGVLAFKAQGARISLVLKLYCGFLWFLSLYWCYIILNLFTKGLYEGTKIRAIGAVSSVLKKLRKSMVFRILLFTGLFCLCFLKTFITWNHSEII